jgi:AraC-like DNA-binding protein
MILMQRKSGEVTQAVPLHRVAVVRPFTNFLADVGAPFERGFRHAGLPVCALEDVDNFIPSHRFWEFLVDMAFSQDIPDLGFRVGQKYGASCADPRMVNLLRRSPTLYQGLLNASEFINKTVSHCQVGLLQPSRSQHAYFYHSPSCDARNPAVEQIGWFGILTLIGMVRPFAGQKWYPKEIGVMTNRVPQLRIREQFWSTRIRLSQPYSYITLDNTLLSLPPLAQQAAAPECPALHCEGLASDFVGSLEQVLHSYIQEKDLSVEFTAGLCDMSKRGMQRKLAENGTCYSELLDRVRFDAAKQMLQDHDRNLTDISHVLGYSDPTHFSRAFRRIAGVTPRVYRQAYSH